MKKPDAILWLVGIVLCALSLEAIAAGADPTPVREFGLAEIRNNAPDIEHQRPEAPSARFASMLSEPQDGGVESVCETMGKVGSVLRSYLAVPDTAVRDALSLPMATLVSMSLIVLLAYMALGLTGFGSSVVAMPLMVIFVPVPFAVSMIVLLDLFGSAFVGAKNRGFIVRAEVRLVVPFMLLGVALGATVLVNAPARWLMLGLGVFVLCYVTYSMLVRIGVKPIRRIWAAPLGILGGVFSALFGSGGPVYAMYLARRLEDKSALRATMGAVVSISSVVRIAAFAVAGLYSQADVFIAAACLAPFMLLGLWCGNRLHHKLPTQRVMQGLWALLAVSGAILIGRSLML